MTIRKYSAGLYRKGDGYKYFLPNHINVAISIENPKIDLLVEKTSKSLGELNVYSTLVPDIDFCVKMIVSAEATISSRIEGTKTEIQQVFLPEEEIAKEQRDDWKEVNNYIEAINYSVSRLKEFPLSMRLVKEAHQKLLSSGRGYSKQPGEIRISQNWIGGTLPSNAKFVPPHHNELPDLLTDLEKFWHNDNLGIPILVKIAIAHYQFETLHPFLDGNGRMGRLLITLELVEKKFVEKPVLYMSYYLEKKRNEYFELLTLVREKNDIESWIIFFLETLYESTENLKDTFTEIIKLQKDYEARIGGLSDARLKKIKNLIHYMFGKPILSVQDIATEFNITFPSANTMVNSLQKVGVLQNISKNQRNRLFSLHEYINLFKYKG